MKPAATQRGAPLPAKIRVRLAASVAERSERRVATDCGCSRQALARALAGLPIYPGTVALVERYLAQQRRGADKQSERIVR